MGLLLSILIAPVSIPECIFTALDLGAPFDSAFWECFRTLGAIDDDIPARTLRGLVQLDEGDVASASSIDWSAFRKEGDKPKQI